MRGLAVAVLHVLAQPFQGLAGVVGHVAVLGVGEAVEVRPEQRQALDGDGLDRLVDALRVLAGQRLAEPLQRLALAQAGQGRAGRLADLRVGVASHQPRLPTAAAR